MKFKTTIISIYLLIGSQLLRHNPKKTLTHIK